jgi:hypothetical protein
MFGVEPDEVPEIRTPIREMFTICCASADEQSEKIKTHTVMTLLFLFTGYSTP